MKFAIFKYRVNFGRGKVETAPDYLRVVHSKIDDTVYPAPATRLHYSLRPYLIVQHFPSTRAR